MSTHHGPPCAVAAKCITLTTGTVHSKQWSQILAQNHDFCLAHLHSSAPWGESCQNIVMTYGMEKLEWCSYPMVKKSSTIPLLVLTESKNVTDGRRDRNSQTDTAWQHRPSLHIASRGKIKVPPRQPLGTSYQTVEKVQSPRRTPPPPSSEGWLQAWDSVWWSVIMC